MKPPVEAPTSSAGEAGGIEREGVERGGELEAAARDVRMGGLGFDRGGLADLLGRFQQRRAVDLDEAGGDGRLRPGAARKEASLDEDDVGALAHGEPGTD